MVECLAGFYCPGGDATSTLPCINGHKCGNGTVVPAPCDPGFWAPDNGTIECEACPRGYYCPTSGAGSSVPPALTEPIVCPEGSYCPTGTSGPRDFLCPVGTFNNRTGLWTDAQCTPCTPGSACTATGLENPDEECAPGHWCGRGAVTITPTDNVTGGICDAGYVCTGGSSTPRPRSGGASPGAAQAYNESGGYLCPLGFECDAGTTREAGCPPSTYNPIGGLDECLECPAGRICPGGNVLPENCPVLHFCVNGSITGEPCPDGFYGAEINLQGAD